MLWVQLIIVIYVIITAVCVANSKKTQQKIDQKRDERLDMVTLKMMHEIAEEYFVKENYFVHILS